MIYANYSQCQDIERETVSAFSSSSSSSFSIGTAQERMPDNEFKNRVIYSQNSPLWNITTQTEKYKVSKPIKVHIYLEDNLFFAENETLVVVGTGNSINEAMDDFCRHIIHFYHYYKRLSRDKVTGDAIRLKKLYDTLLAEQE